MKETGRIKQVRLGEFTRASLQAQAAQRGVDVSALLRQAVVYYAADRGSGRQGWRLPRFASGGATSREGMGALEIEMSDVDWEALAEEAGLQDADEERLLEHAALYYLADLEAGRIAARILRSLGDPPEESD